MKRLIVVWIVCADRDLHMLIETAEGYEAISPSLISMGVVHIGDSDVLVDGGMQHSC